MTYVRLMFRARANSTDRVSRISAADQPRPALGRRPWFALLRRARSLRRFALAIRPGSVACLSDPITLASREGTWDASPVAIAGTAGQRLLGVKTGADRVLLRTRAVHGRGVRRGLRLVAINDAGVVVAVRALGPGGFAWLRGATWVLEQPLDASQPAVGTRLAIYPHRCARTSSSLCDTDRKPERRL